MINLSNVLVNRKGSGYIWAITIVLALVIVFSGISKYLRIQMIVGGVRDSLQSAVISVATANYDDLYNGLREGYSGGYKLTFLEQWQRQVDRGSIYYQLDQLLGLREEGGYHVKQTNKFYEFRLSGLDVDIINAPLAPNNRSNAQRFEAIAYITLEVPYSFGFDKLPPLKLNLKVNAGYTPKF